MSAVAPIAPEAPPAYRPAAAVLPPDLILPAARLRSIGEDAALARTDADAEALVLDALAEFAAARGADMPIPREAFDIAWKACRAARRGRIEASS